MLAQNGHQVIWDDCIAEKRTLNQFWSRLLSKKPDLIAIETKTPVVKQHWDLSKRIKEWLPDIYIVFMGDHVTAKPMETMQNSSCDFLITGGDYDFLLFSIVDHLISGKGMLPGIWYRNDGIFCQTGSFQNNHFDLNALPWIDRKLTKWQLYGEKLYKRQPFTYTMAGRDCPYGRCTFCSWTTLYPKFRVRSPENLVEEIEYLVKEFSIQEIFDDTGTFPPGNWLERFCRLMINKGLNKKVLISCNFRCDYLTQENAKLMKAAGFRLLKIGLESANQETLDRLKKGTTVSDIENSCRIAKQAGLDVHLTVMVGYPWETLEDAENTVQLSHRLMRTGMADMLQATMIVPYPGTLLYESVLENNWFCIDPTDYDKMDMSQPVLKTPGITSNGVKNLCQRTYQSFFSPGYLYNQLSGIRSWQDVQYYLRGLKPVLGHFYDFK